MAIAHYVSNGRAAFGGLVYCVLTYGIGFVLGTIRVLLITPNIGPIFAVMLELPFMVLASALVCPRVIIWFSISDDFGQRMTMGAVGFTALMLIEAGMGQFIFGQTPTVFLDALLTPEGMLGLFGQLCFALMPIVISKPGFQRG